MMSRQPYPPEFKRRTLELLAENGKSVPQLAKKLGISENTCYGWRHTAKTDTGFTRQPQSSDQPLEIKRLKKKISALAEDKLLLKTAAVLFSKESRKDFINNQLSLC